MNKRMLLFGACLFMAIRTPAFGDDTLKEPALAGSWYAKDPAQLSRDIDGYLSLAVVPDSFKNLDIGVVISPHAGYAFSGAVAGHGFKAAMNRRVRAVVILAPTHSVAFSGASVWVKGAFVTPLGQVQVDEALARKILEADKRFTFRRDVFDGASGRPENSVETQIPFIQKAFPEAKIVPIILGYPPDPSVLRAMAETLAALSRDRQDMLVVVSVDQSHFHPDAEARRIDVKGLEAIKAMDIERFWDGHVRGEMEVDGFHVVATAMLYAKAAGYSQAEILKYATSADVTGDPASVVGYASVVFSRPPHLASTENTDGVSPLSADAKRRLLEIARTTVDALVTTGRAPEVNEADPRLQAEEGVFVTLKKHGQLRGCIGNIIGQGPLYQTVRSMAIAAASQDPRFDPVVVGELKDIAVEVSVLSKPRKVKSADDIVLGKHGVIVRRGYARGGVFLPQVATETGWSKEKFLSELCAQKAGLAPDAWKDPATTLEVFSADVFGEK